MKQQFENVKNLLAYQARSTKQQDQYFISRQPFYEGQTKQRTNKGRAYVIALEVSTGLFYRPVSRYNWKTLQVNFRKVPCSYVSVQESSLYYISRQMRERLDYLVSSDLVF